MKIDISLCTIRKELIKNETFPVTEQRTILHVDRAYGYAWVGDEIFLIYINDAFEEAQSIDFDF